MISMPDELVERFWDKVEVDISTGCWNWIGNRDQLGYGRFSSKEFHGVAHRFAYEVNKGKIPEGLELDHLCRNRSCVNPEHLEAVTHQENVLRGTSFSALEAQQTHCIRGHLLDGRNLRIESTGSRRCRRCEQMNSRIKRARKSEFTFAKFMSHFNPIYKTKNLGKMRFIWFMNRENPLTNIQS